MSDYILSCCSTADLSKEHFEARDIRYTCFHYFVDGKEYSDDLGLSLPFDKFYALMKSGAETRTAQINISEYLEFFSKFLEQGKDILHVSLSSGLSGTVGSARNAALIALERYPGRKILIIDSLCASSGYGLFMDKLADLRDSGMSIDELYRWGEDNKLRLRHWFFSTDLSSYIKGGRISKHAGLIGTILGICPLLHMDNEGKLIPMDKVRTKKKVMQRIVDCMEREADAGLDYSGKSYICQSACIDDAKAVAAIVEGRFKKLNGKVEINNIGTTIGSHTGPGTIALFFWAADNNRG